ncbi:MAG: metallophosphoesterase [Acidobacteriota bacterium]
MRLRRSGNLLILAGAVALGHAQRPDFSFGVIADIQYADKDTAGAREYRKSIEKLEACVAALRTEKPAFTIQLGDLIDEGLANLDRILPVFNRIPAPRRHVLGNHDFCAARDIVLKRLGLRSAYYQFSSRGWRFVVLDGMEVSVAPESSQRELGARLLAALKASGAGNAQAWNGAVGPHQREWLRKVLREAASRRERAIVFCHFPALAESCRPEHLLWDHREVVEILESERSAVAFMNGHDHRGGYAEKNGVHYLTFPGLVESDAGRTCKVVDVYRDRLVVRSAGQADGQVLRIGR